jgi:hypothetical protein
MFCQKKFYKNLPRITINIFNSEAPFRFFHTVGWGKCQYNTRTLMDLCIYRHHIYPYTTTHTHTHIYIPNTHTHTHTHTQTHTDTQTQRHTKTHRDTHRHTHKHTHIYITYNTHIYTFNFRRICIRKYTLFITNTYHFMQCVVSDVILLV